jgi:hypothetical protein
VRQQLAKNNFYKICMCGAARSNCHIFMLSYLATLREKIASKPAVARSHCILATRDLGMLGACFWTVPLVS